MNLKKIKIRKKNKKAAIGGIILLVVTLFVWVLMWIIVDVMDYAFDSVINETWEDLDPNETWYDSYGTFKDRKTDFKQITYYSGVIILLIGIGGMAYKQKIEDKRFS